MLRNLISLQYGGFKGGYFEEILSTWESWGVFYYLLPFIIIFSIVFVTLDKIKLFSDASNGDSYRGINAMVSFAVGLMAIFSSEKVPEFFQVIFPNLGIALGVIVASIIAFGMFIDPKKKALVWPLIAIGGVGLAAVLFYSLRDFSYYGHGGIDWQGVVPQLVIAGIIIAVVLIPVFSGPKSGREDRSDTSNPFSSLFLPKTTSF